MSGFMKTVHVKDCTKIAGIFLENQSDSVHRYGQCSSESAIYLVYS